MFWNKEEKDRGLPELPPLKASKPMEFPSESEAAEPEEGSLPSFPNTPMRNEPTESEHEELEELPSKFRLPKIREINEQPSRRMTAEINPAAKTEDVYVKIDRFHSARRALNSARDKLKEIEELMKKIRETKMREEQELSSWEEEIETVKSKVEDVTNSIFEKVE